MKFPDGGDCNSTRSTTATYLRSLALAAVTAFLATSSVSRADDAVPPLKKGDRIVFLGDSITARAVKAGGFVTLVHDSIEAAHPALGIETLGVKLADTPAPVPAGK